MSKKNSSVQKLKKFFEVNQLAKKNFINFEKKSKKLNLTSGVVAISGGADSLALAALIKLYNIKNKKKLFRYIHIDHSIRKNSKSEALKVKKILKKIEINSIILSNKKKIKKNIQKEARDIRYNLLKNFCLKNRLKFLLTGHHSEDQVETFFIRLSRGSGIKGLSSMREITKLSKHLKLFRPFLDVEKKELSIITKNIFGAYIKDPSNKNTKFLRTKIRQLKDVLESKGISYRQILKSIKNISSSEEIIDQYINKTYKNLVSKKKRVLLIDYKKFLKEKKEIRIKVVEKAIKSFSINYYPPRAAKIDSLILRLVGKNQKKQTLGGCIVEKLRNDTIKISKEI